LASAAPTERWSSASCDAPVRLPYGQADQIFIVTIAVSVAVHPSRGLLLAIHAMSLMAMLAAFLILFQPYELSAGIRLQISAIASISVGVAIFKVGRHRKTFHIDISGIGQIRLTQYSGVSGIHEDSGSALDGNTDVVVHLSPDSVLWPHFLLLRLKPDRGSVISVPVLPDSISGPGFAYLSVACRYIAMRNANDEIID
jgi:toxin CptA